MMISHPKPPGPAAASRAPRPPIARSSLRESAARILRSEIVSGAIRPDEIYAIGDIAAELGTSPTPVREALVDLVAQGLVVMVRNRGFRVYEFTEQDVDELFELRAMLEAPAMAKLAGLQPRPDLTTARDLADQTVAAAVAGDVHEFLAIDRDFHLHLTGLLGNERLVNIVAQLRDQTRLYGMSHELPREKASGSAHDHIELTDAIAAGHAAEAEAIMRCHLDQIRVDWARPALTADTEHRAARRLPSHGRRARN
jgi:DNA-binding GntR family transcriptional regulator